MTKPSMIIELVIVGIFALYLTTLVILPYLISSISGAHGIPYFMPMWLYYDSTPMEIGCIVLGYELSIFSIRFVKLRKRKNADKAEGSAQL